MRVGDSDSGVAVGGALVRMDDQFIGGDDHGGAAFAFSVFDAHVITQNNGVATLGTGAFGGVDMPGFPMRPVEIEFRFGELQCIFVRKMLGCFSL